MLRALAVKLPQKDPALDFTCYHAVGYSSAKEL
jgi:hypothetical protein